MVRVGVSSRVIPDAEALPGDLLGDLELRGLIVTLADDLVDVQSCDEESMSDRWWERYSGY